MADLYERIAADVPQIERGKVWCIACGRMQRVDGAEALRNGWPMCCGATMTIDSPQWRRAHPRGVQSTDGYVEAGLVCQACAVDAPGGKCKNPRCVGGPIVRELVPAAGVPGGQAK